ncbi:4-hydroxy-tetrahydrodipicolinate synthase [Paenibacillus crassostreae]|uniref:4-hydroxy-tetrahydrodipicolinate synthase n=1 Tax=Paenibacillus crassostreae TaxID=1763538 RepID=A0A167FLK8_9BACL|nr:4-hydroxy-tetrahydrodipicolinate synthase [Paenibacillus crassostreae]AOZ94277.1 4-hydroxy-tetrahydrodipicolinate synthase [Paenibacillus crassostreae]OAB76687.1 4-hydroxy-tetrahydrodipicolinate synthase [Paenibacillus crassostreae]
MEFGRLITAMVTPFDERGQINWDETARLIDYLILDQKSDSLVIGGTTGESPTLSDQEKLELFRFAIDKANNRCKIIAGTGSNNTAHSIYLTQEAEKLGVDGLLLVVPYYNKPSQEGMFRHFEAIAQSTELPIIVYNVPSRTMSSLSVKTTLRLANIPNIVGTKECASLEHVTLVATSAPADFKVYTGDDSVTLPALAVGAYGVISVAAHVVGSSMKDMIDSFNQGDVREATALHQKLFPIFKGLFDCPDPLPNPAAIKYALQLLGHDVGEPRLPIIPPNEDEMKFIKELIAVI